MNAQADKRTRGRRFKHIPDHEGERVVNETAMRRVDFTHLAALAGSPKSEMWRWHVRLGRTQLSLRIYRHGGQSPDRWVVQPGIVYDRKSKLRG